MRAVEHRLLGAGEGPGVTVLPGGHGGAGVGVGQGRQPLTGRERSDHVGALLRAAAGGDQPAGQHDRREVGLGSGHPAELLAHDADLDRAGADAAVVLGEGQAEQAHLRHPRPQGLVVAGLLRGHLPPVLVVGVGLADQAAHGVAEGLLLVVVGEVHRRPLQSPRIRPAMICRWISFEPP